MRYSEIKISEEEINSEKYKLYLGGGIREWEKRGLFQILLMEKIGLNPEHSLVDIGCGPLRSGIHLIKYLKKSGYFGLDVNEDFINISNSIISASKLLLEKNPKLHVSSSFEMPKQSEKFDYGLAFSVLNHCTNIERHLFFKNLLPNFKKSGKIIITHASWFKLPTLCRFRININKKIKMNIFCNGLRSPQFNKYPYRIINIFDKSEQIEANLKLEEWGWHTNETIFPIVEIAKI